MSLRASPWPRLGKPSPSSTSTPRTSRDSRFRPPTTRMSCTLLVNSAGSGGELDRAEMYWEAARSQDPHHAESLGDLGALRLLAGDTATAAEFLREAVLSNPRLASAWYSLARIHLARGEWGEATEALRSFVDAAGPLYAEQVAWARRILAELGRSRGGGPSNRGPFRILGTGVANRRSNSRIDRDVESEGCT